jgi:hypothetical protein
MKSLSRAAGPLALVLTMAVSLSACSSSSSDDDDDQYATPDASAQTCRLAAVAHAYLDGPRDGVARGQFTTGALAAYDTAMVRLSKAVASEGEIDAEVTQVVLQLMGAYSRTRAFAEANALATSYQTTEVQALVAAEERLYGELVAVCPALGDTDQD